MAQGMTTQSRRRATQAWGRATRPREENQLRKVPTQSHGGLLIYKKRAAQPRKKTTLTKSNSITQEDYAITMEG